MQYKGVSDVLPVTKLSAREKVKSHFVAQGDEGSPRHMYGSLCLMVCLAPAEERRAENVVYDCIAVLSASYLEEKKLLGLSHFIQRSSQRELLPGGDPSARDLERNLVRPRTPYTP